MLEIYIKSFKKTYYLGLITGIIVALLVTIVISIWPEFKAQSASFEELLNSPLYSAILGSTVNLKIGEFQGFYGMYLFIYLEMILLFLGIFYGASLISREFDKNTLDSMLSLPISRKRFISEKFMVYISNTFMIPISVIIITILFTFVIDEPFDSTQFIYAAIAYWLLFVALGTISLLMGTIFLESTKSYVAAGILILGMWIIERIGGLVASLRNLQNLSLFHYINGSTILTNGISSVFVDIIIVIVVSLLCFLASLIVFDKRELTTS